MKNFDRKLFKYRNYTFVNSNSMLFIAASQFQTFYFGFDKFESASEIDFIAPCISSSSSNAGHPKYSSTDEQPNNYSNGGL